MAKIKVANHKYICPECKGNGYNKVYDMIVQTVINVNQKVNFD